MGRKTIGKLALIIGLSICCHETAWADCPDGRYRCPLTGMEITYGNCWDWSSVSCKPCRSSYKDACDSSLYNRWMTQDAKLQASPLAAMTIPGAHDAGMGKVSSCSDYAGKDVTQTQDRSFLQMLNSGIRYFDLRPVIDKNGAMYLGHYSWIGRNIDLGVHTFTLRNEGCLGYSVDEMLADVAAFVSSSSPVNREVVLLIFSHFKNFKKYDDQGSHFDQQDLDQLENKVTAALEPHLVKGNTQFLTTPLQTLANGGARALVIFDHDGYDGSKGIYSQKYLDLFDKYSNTNDFNTMKADQFKKLRASSDTQYFLLSWTLTQSDDQAIGCMIPGNLGAPFGYACESIESLASKANAHLHEIVQEAATAKKYPNVIYTDFVSESHTKISILTNQARAR